MDALVFTQLYKFFELNNTMINKCLKKLTKQLILFMVPRN